MAAKKNGTGLKNALMKAKPAIVRALPSHVKPDTIISAALTAASLNTDLSKCSEMSIVRSVVMASQLGLQPGTLGSCYLVPFKGTCQLIIGYRGLIDLARRSGAVKSVEGRVVYDCDEFDYSYGTDTHIRHVPELNRPANAQMVCAYAVVTLTDGGKQIEVMSRADVEKRRAVSQTGNRPGGPWVQWFEEMARKTVAKKALQWSPMSSELATAIDIDSRADVGEDALSTALPELSDDVIDGDPVDTADELERELAGAGSSREPGEDG